MFGRQCGAKQDGRFAALPLGRLRVAVPRSLRRPTLTACQRVSLRGAGVDWIAKTALVGAGGPRPRLCKPRAEVRTASEMHDQAGVKV